MFKRLTLLLLLSFFSLQALATDYTDIWWNPNESGWGVNFAQNEGTIFATLFVYAPNGAATWYAGSMDRDANGNFSGAWYASTGPYFGAATFDPRQVGVVRVGTATFQPGAADFGTFVYSVGNVGVSKSIQRQSLTTISLIGNYRGGMTRDITQCSNPNSNSAADLYTDISVGQSGGGAVQFNVQVINGPSCTLNGTLEQFGQLYRVTNATYICSDGVNTRATLYEVKATSQGIEGRWTANLAFGCREDTRFSAILR